MHMPFCVRKCRYCDFYSVPLSDNSPLVNKYIDALSKEWEFYKYSGILDDKYIHTIYIGGGTPSLLNVDSWERLDKLLFSAFNKPQLKEWSVECNPESFTIEKARAYAESGVTRLTFGVQSLDARELSVCGRAHGAERALEVLRYDCLNEMFDSIGVDIIYALPGQTVNTLDDTLSSILSVPSVKHISAYELTIAKNTPFGRHKKILPLPAEELSAEMYELIGKRCAERGMVQYEVSNYALPGFESVHNKAYWSHKPYIGLGASAHSYIHPKRWSNIADVNRYILSMSSISLTSYSKFKISNISSIPPNTGAVNFEETLSPLELSREIIFLGLRNEEGIDEEDFFAKTGIELCADGRGERLQKYADTGLLKRAGKKYIPTSKGMLFADMMAREL
jgi:oxygen-independent coproporphyrinogen-3 oxidase